MEKNTHSVEVVRVKIEDHPNADRLQIASIFGFTCCVAKGSFQDGQLAAYIQPDSVVDSTRPEFEFLSGHERIKVKKLRGIVSMGLLMPAPEGAQEGDDVAEYYGVTHYEPPIPGERCGEVEGGPIGLYAPKYDVESMYRYKSLFVEGEPVIATEKIHGCVTSKALVSLANGETQYISTLKTGQEILGVDMNGRLTTTRILNTFNNGKAGRWLKIKGNRRACGRGSSFFALVCTPEHKVWSASQQDYVCADSLKVGEKVSLVRSEMGLTPVQEQVLLGKILGDGSINCIENSAHIAWTHRKADSGYIDWCGQAIGSIDSGAREPLTSGYGSEMIRSRTSNSFWIKNKFESFIVDGNKTIPEWVADELTPLSLAFWYMDDGSLGTQEDQEDRAMFATCGFTDSDCRVLLRGLKRLGINGTLYESCGYARIRLNSDDAERFFLLVAPYIPPAMQRKLPSRYRGHFGWIPTQIEEYKPSIVEQEITSIEEAKGVRSERYDISTGTQNYFANGVLIHNCNSRFVYAPNEDRMYCGSRGEWKAKNEGNLWWRALAAHPWIEEFCRQFPGDILYGEVFGNVQSLKYGAGPNDVFFRAFDVMHGSEWREYEDWTQYLSEEKRVPVVFGGEFDFDMLVKLSDGPSLIPNANHIREGIVVRPIPERTHEHLGRVHLKLVGNSYLEKS